MPLLFNVSRILKITCTPDRSAKTIHNSLNRRKEKLAPQARFELATLRLTVVAVKNLSATSVSLIEELVAVSDREGIASLSRLFCGLHSRNVDFWVLLTALR